MDDVSRRGAAERALVDQWKAVDARRRQLQQELDQLRAQRNAANERMARLDKKSPEFAAARDELKALSQRIKEGEQTEAQVGEESRQLLLTIPNAPHPSVPDGDENPVLHTWGEKPRFDFAPRPHWELGEGQLDFEAGVRIAGARFTVLRSSMARLTRALMSYMIDTHTARGYTEVWPPAMVRRAALIGTGQLPKFEADLFAIKMPADSAAEPDNDLFLSPTAEVQVTNLFLDTILEASELPQRLCAYAPCFRAEAGAAGKDTRGLIRQHQFDKVELVKIVPPDASYAELEGLREDAEAILQGLELHYRVVTLTAQDIGFGGAKTYDLEVWLPGQDAYREISSCTNYEDFQARRAKIRYRPAVGEKPRPVHTINGSGLAIGRTIVAILEQHQRADGSVAIPKVLRPYLGGAEALYK
jgi:seryl-tRNA synthetase